MTGIERPREPYGGDIAWYRGWEAFYDLEAAKWTGSGWRAYKGGCDLDAPEVSAKDWDGLLDAVDEKEDA